MVNPEKKHQGFDNIPIRFFIYDDACGDFGDDYGAEIRECSEAEFMDCSYPVSYERHTVHANGVSQICLTKFPGEGHTF